MAYYEWQGNAFGPLLPDGLIPIPESVLNVTERHIPYSDASVTDIGGRSPRHYRARIKLTVAAFVSMESEIGETSDLTLGNVVYPDATLLGLTNIRETPQAEYVLTDADWLL